MGTGATAYEKRGTAVTVPEWDPENVSNVTNVHSYVLTLQFVHSY